jgi:hypothetical protein
VTTRFLGKLNFKLKKKIGKATIFTAEEKALVWCRIAMNYFGFPVNNTDLQCNVKECLQSKGRTVAKFKNTMPHTDWAQNILKRHPLQVTVSVKLL